MAGKIFIEYTEKDIMELIRKDIENQLNIAVNAKQIEVVVKSKQNYKSEWERAVFKATFDTSRAVF